MTTRRNPTAPIARDHDHNEHGQPYLVPESLSDYMDHQRVSCLNHGAHAHGTHSMHHHHDLTCLIEAGRNEMEPSLDLAERRVKEVERRVLTLSAKNDTLTHTNRHLQRQVDDARAQLAEIAEFMSQSPAIGPWRTVEEMWKDAHDEAAPILSS